ncbi:hypothetical protein GV51_0850 [Gardnerella vaginalis 5-1]|nr:hypothetical protein GV51_0850 [Gardnerella vaginalis 5-1]
MLNGLYSILRIVACDNTNLFIAHLFRSYSVFIALAAKGEIFSKFFITKVAFCTQ